ncbi:hypothetical protein V5O48_016141 [Marasmius crinis-equi]|uniref:Uncharacterized protein n=1 Tax=Marasmius crinis-equi TaxID=585013 RepID=A0ABR3ESL0_9AGAR
MHMTDPSVMNNTSPITKAYQGREVGTGMAVGHPANTGQAENNSKAGPGLVDKTRGTTEITVGKVLRNHEMVERGQKRKATDTHTTSA